MASSAPSKAISALSRRRQGMSQPADSKNRRARAKIARREQLIAATMKCIARMGLSNMTLRHVAEEAGLSQGIVNLHFDSKDNLLNETLRHLTDEYLRQFEQALANAEPTPGARLLTALELDLKPSICDRNKLAVWFAFWGESRSRPTYRRISGEADQRYDDDMEQLCADVIADGDYTGVTARAASEALTAMTYGIWLSRLINPQPWNRKAAMEAIMSYLRNVFPAHYS